MTIYKETSMDRIVTHEITELLSKRYPQTFGKIAEMIDTYGIDDTITILELSSILGYADPIRWMSYNIEDLSRFILEWIKYKKCIDPRRLDVLNNFVSHELVTKAVWTLLSDDKIVFDKNLRIVE